MTMTRVITQRAIGGSDVLELAEIPLLAPGPGEVLVRVRATGMNPADWKVRIGKVDFFGPPPFVLGHEFSGTVEGIGEGVTRFAVGEEVYGWTVPPQGSHADHVVVTEDRGRARAPALLRRTPARRCGARGHQLRPGHGGHRRRAGGTTPG
ncbi:alcohol dehydrogenase catalytic domain-containing protein [Streptomyces sp. NPDC051366]|uniref:alcohol dehydrogenase catalytic domain-containing protein n=1 Tax=Streptomyces sp. NPDC051366 TaxID=3365652 RepID=UPI0037B32A80